MRKYALIWALPTIVTAGGIIFELALHNREHFDRILDLWWVFGLSFILFVGTVWLIWKQKYYGRAFRLIGRPVCARFLRLWHFTLSILAISVLDYL